MIDNYDSFVAHVLNEYPKEACGYVINNIFTPVINTHSDPINNFSFSETISFELTKHKKYLIVHSHTGNVTTHDPRAPSKEDMEGQQNTLQPWGIVHTNGTEVSEMLIFGPPSQTELLNRPYIPNVYDCFTIARDYFAQNYHIDIGNHSRPVNWQEWNPNYIENTYKKIGFSPVPAENVLSPGDVVLFAIGSRYCNHIGVMLDQETFVHHLHNRLSCTDNIKKWHKQIKKVVRWGYE